MRDYLFINRDVPTTNSVLGENRNNDVRRTQQYFSKILKQSFKNNIYNEMGKQISGQLAFS